MEEERITNCKNRVFKQELVFGKNSEIKLTTNETSTYRETGYNQILDIIESGYIRPKEGKLKGGHKNEIFWTIGGDKLFYYDKTPVLEVPSSIIKDGQYGALKIDDLIGIWIFSEEENKYINELDKIKNKHKEYQMLKQKILETTKELKEKYNFQITEEELNNYIKALSKSNSSLEDKIKLIEAKRKEMILKYTNKANEKEYPLNELFNCRITDKTLHIHIAPKSVKEEIDSIGIREYMKYADGELEEALSLIADIITTKETDIEKIFAVSPTLKNKFTRELFEKYGFDTKMTDSDYFKEMFNTDGVGEAIITREKFLSLEKQRQEVRKQGKIKKLVNPSKNNQGFISLILMTIITILFGLIISIIVIK